MHEGVETPIEFMESGAWKWVQELFPEQEFALSPSTAIIRQHMAIMRSLVMSVDQPLFRLFQVPTTPPLTDAGQALA